MAADNDQNVYWNEKGGERWVRYIDHLEQMLTGFSEVLIERLAPRPGEHILDIGCGGGPTSAAIADAVGPSGRVLGVDISSVILEVARARHGGRGNLELVLADAGEHAFEPGAFDAVTSRFGVMFFHAPEAAFRNIHAAARAGARLVFICWRQMEENPWMGAAAQAAFSVLPPPEPPDPEAPGPFAFADAERVRRILTEAGFTGIALEPVDQTIRLGPLEHALDWLINMGPAADALQEAAPAEREAAIAAMRAALAAGETAEGVVAFPGATWLVTARAA